MHESNALNGSVSLDTTLNWNGSAHREANRNKEKQLEAELADARLLHKLSTELIQEDGTTGLYKKIVEAAVAIMGSQYASMQMLYPEQGSIGKLRLLASSNFSAEAEKFWEWVYSHTGSSCGVALNTRRRAIIPNFATCELMHDKPTLPIFLEAGIYAAQSTPLYSRSGKLLGMISTHWSSPHTPSERDLYLLDILARQAADLIERTQTSEALRESEERLRALTSATNDVIYRMSPDWKEMYHLDGRNFLNDTGAPIDSWLEKYIHPDDYELVTLTIKRAIKTKQVFQLEHRVFKADGKVGWVFSRAVPICNDEGGIIEWFGAASDVTEKNSLMNTLEETVEERTRDLQRSNEDLQQFAHVASHDLKEPVRKIRTYGLRLRDELNGHANQHQKIYTEKILESASRMATMIDGVLTYSSLNAFEQKLETVDLNKIVSDIQNDLEVLIDMKSAAINYNALPTIEGNQVLIYQLFYNLINNSLKFSRQHEKPLITITGNTFSRDGLDYARVLVTDNGIGFDPEFNGEIFQTFTRLNSKSNYDGTGLGLSLAKKIVERHHGMIEANGNPGVGAVFTITIPVKQLKTA